MSPFQVAVLTLFVGAVTSTAGVTSLSVTPYGAVLSVMGGVLIGTGVHIGLRQR